MSAHTIVFLNCVLEQPRSKMSPRVHGDNLLVVSPLREGANIGGRLGVGKIGSVSDLVSTCSSVWDARQTGDRCSTRC